MIEILWLILMIGLNILICYLYRANKYFPIIFMIFEVLYGLSIVESNELFIVFCVTFIVFYNFFIMNEQRLYKYV